MHFNFDTPFMEAFEELNKLGESTHTDEDPYGYGPYKVPTDPTLEVGDYIKAKQYSRDDKWYPARVTRITPDFVDYTISGFGFVKNGTMVRSDKAKRAFGNLRTYLGLTEATDRRASIEFWDWAKDNKISTYWFHKAFDSELADLGLTDIFNSAGMLKDSATWGRIKAALEANPESWAVKALKKMWVLQFTKGVTKSLEQILRDAKEADRQRRKRDIAARQEQERIEIETRQTTAKEEQVILSEKLSAITTLVETIAKEFAEEKKAEVLSALKTTEKLESEIKTVTKGIVKFYGSATKRHLDRINSSSSPIKVSVTLPEINERDPYPQAGIKVVIQEFLGETGPFETTYITADLTEEEKVKSTMLSLLEKVLDSVCGYDLRNLSSMQEKYDSIMTKVNAAKEAQAAADAGRPVDPKFISSVLDEFKRGKQNAQREYARWSDSTDGSAGAAHALATYEALVEIGVALVNCNWRAVIGDREIASWKMSDSVDSLRGELQEVFDAFSPELTLEITKD